MVNIKKKKLDIRGMDIEEVIANSPVVYKYVRKSKEAIMACLGAIIIIGVVYTILAPVIGIISLSFMSPQDIFNPMVFLIPAAPSFYNVINAVRFMNYWSSLAYTLAYSVGLGLLHVLVASFVGYGFARFRFWGNGLIFGLILFTIIMPAQTFMVPMFMLFRSFGPTNVSLLDSYASIIILTSVGMGLRSGLFIYIFRQFFKGLPTELSEAAYIDGAGTFRTYATIMMPNAKPSIITVLLLSLVWHYGDTFYSGLLLSSSRFIHVAAMNLFDAYNAGNGIHAHDASLMSSQMVSYAGVLMVIVPILVIYAFLQRQFIEGIERCGIVG